jgi:spore coat protein CotH
MSPIARLTTCIVAATVVLGNAVITPAAAAAAVDPQALKRATASCKADVKEQARYHEMSWWAQHKAVKKCIKDTLAAGK